MINVFEPTLSQDELLAVADSFNTKWIGKGPKVAAFEAAWANHIGADSAHVVSANSCTEALFTAVKLLGIGPGDEVIIPTIHFVGAAQAVIAAGARPVFCDVDRRTLNATDEFIWTKVTGDTKAIILNHYGGVSCSDLELIRDRCKNTIHLIEDAACAPASTYNGQPVGTFGDIGVWSFDAMKIITTGDGGMMYIRDDELAARARKLLYLGIDTENGLGSNTDSRWWEFGVSEPGARRSVMNDIAAGVGLEQLKRLPELVSRRLRISFNYDCFLRDIPDVLEKGYNQSNKIRNDSSYYFFWIQTPHRDELARYLREQDCYTTFRYYPLHRAFKTGDHLPNADYAADNTLLLPFHCNLTDEQVSFICGKVREFYDNKT